MGEISNSSLDLLKLFVNPTIYLIHAKLSNFLTFQTDIKTKDGLYGIYTIVLD